MLVAGHGVYIYETELPIGMSPQQLGSGVQKKRITDN